MSLSIHSKKTSIIRNKLQSWTDHIHHRFMILPLFSSLRNHSLPSPHSGLLASASVLQRGSKRKAASVALAGDAALAGRGQSEGRKYWQVHLLCWWVQHHCRHACSLSGFHMVGAAWKIILALAWFLTWWVFSFCHALLCSNSYAPIKLPSLLPRTVLQTFK